METPFFTNWNLRQRALDAARKRNNDYSLGVRGRNGLHQIISIEHYDNGRHTVTPLSDWITIDDAIAFLNSL